MKVLVVGGGGREHALAWKAAQSERVERVYVAPGNAGTAREPRLENVAIQSTDIHALARFAARRRIDLTIIGAEAPLVMGVVEVFAERGLRCLGPTRAAAQLEGSKIFAKDFLTRHAIPTAPYRTFTELDAALSALSAAEYPLVIKADGLAAGKGVLIAENRRQAAAALTDMLARKRYGAAGSRVLVEQFVRGEEVSFIALVDGKTILPMASSQDHKAAYDGDRGPNTGGMGAYSPAPIVNEAMHAQIMRRVMRPTVQGMAAEGMPYSGFLYAGLMIGDDGIPQVLEFNCRCGDPETQPIMLRLRSDLVAHCMAAVEGNLVSQRAHWDVRCALGVVMAADGYPGECRVGDWIHGLADSAVQQDDAAQKIFHAGTGIQDGKIVVSGGRVVCATACADNVHAAQQAAYQLAKQLSWQGCWYRADIGHRAIKRELAEQPVAAH